MNTHMDLWTEKWRPKQISEYIFHDGTHRAAFNKFIAAQSIPQLLFAGIQGCGKTTIARVLIHEIGIDELDVLTINASKERGIDTFRDKIANFANTMPFGSFKVIHLEEADGLTPDFQKALKSFMEDVSDSVRFILTCNHVNKINPAIRSRCQEFFFKSPNIDDITEHMVHILQSEQVKFTLDALDECVRVGYPDIRKIINLLQQKTVNGVLGKLDDDDNTSSNDYSVQLLDLISQNQWTDARKLLCSSVTAEEWEFVYRFLYDNIDKSPVFKKGGDKWEQAIITIAEHLYKHGFVADPDINAAAMLIQLGHIANG